MGGEWVSEKQRTAVQPAIASAGSAGSAENVSDAQRLQLEFSTESSGSTRPVAAEAERRTPSCWVAVVWQSASYLTTAAAKPLAASELSSLHAVRHQQHKATTFDAE